MCANDSEACSVGGDAESFQHRFAVLADMSSDGICVHQEGRIVFANTAAVRWMGVEPSVGLVGRRVSEFVHADSYPTVERRLDRLRRDGDSAPPAEVVMGRPRKSARDVQATSTRIEWGGRPAVVTNFRDLTTVKASASLKYQAALLDHVSDAVIGTCPAGTVTSWNSAAEAIYGRDAQRVLHHPVTDAVGAPLDAEHVLQRGGVLYTTHFSADGSPLSIRVSSAATNHGHVLICADLTALRRAEHHFEAVVTAIDAGIVVFRYDGSMESANPAARRIFAKVTDTADPFADDVPMVDADGRPLAADRRPLRQALASGIPQVDRIVGVIRADGQRIWLSLSARSLSPEHAGHSSILCSFVDVTAQRLMSEQLVHAAGHDALTALPNRSSALARLAASLAQGAEQRVNSVLFIDLDNLKLVNDSHGHGAGDAVLIATARRMGAVLGDEHMIARLAGDEFVVLLFGHLGQKAVDALVADLHRAVSEPIRFCDNDVIVTASIGVTMSQADDDRDAGELLRAADEAMYAAKTVGPGLTRYSN